jgi:hypothetical protein
MNGNQELFQHRARAITGWTTRSSNQFNHDDIKNNHGLGGRFWFKAVIASCDAWNVTHEERIGPTPWSLETDAWREKNNPDLRIRLQGMGLSQQRKKKKQKAYA